MIPRLNSFRRFGGIPLWMFVPAGYTTYKDTYLFCAYIALLNYISVPLSMPLQMSAHECERLRPTLAICIGVGVLASSKVTVRHFNWRSVKTEMTNKNFPTSKLTYPLRIDSWKTKFPFKKCSHSRRRIRSFSGEGVDIIGESKKVQYKMYRL